MKWRNNIWQNLESTVSKLLIPFVSVFTLAFIIFGINGTLVAQLKEVHNLLHAATVVALLYGFFRIVKAFRKYVAAPQQAFHIKKQVRLLTIGSFIALTISFFCLCFLYLYKGQYTIDYTAPLLPAGSISILLTFIVAAFFEELMMRYFLLGLLLKNKWPFWLAVIVSSALFSYVHQYQAQSEEWYLYVHTAAFLLGICFCLLYWAYGSFWLAVSTHTMWNIINGLFYEESTSTFLTLHELNKAGNILLFSIICLVLCSLIGLFYKRALKNYLSFSRSTNT